MPHSGIEHGKAGEILKTGPKQKLRQKMRKSNRISGQEDQEKNQALKIGKGENFRTKTMSSKCKVMIFYVVASVFVESSMEIQSSQRRLTNMTMSPS